jgi:hypothetical protein
VVVDRRHASEDLAARDDPGRISRQSTNASPGFRSLLETQKMNQGWDRVVHAKWRNSDRLRVSQGEFAEMRGDHEGSGPKNG